MKDCDSEENLKAGLAGLKNEVGEGLALKTT